MIGVDRAMSLNIAGFDPDDVGRRQQSRQHQQCCSCHRPHRLGPVEGRMMTPTAATAATAHIISRGNIMTSRYLLEVVSVWRDRQQLTHKLARTYFELQVLCICGSASRRHHVRDFITLRQRSSWVTYPSRILVIAS